MDEGSSVTVLSEFEQDLTDSEYARIQEDQSSEFNKTPDEWKVQTNSAGINKMLFLVVWT